MGSSYKYLRGSDGTGNAVLAHITSPRSAAATAIVVDSLSKWSPFYIVTTGTLDSNGYMTPASMTEMYAHTNAGQIIIDGFVPGYTDVGNTAGQVAIVKPTNHFANSVVDQALVAHADDGSQLPTSLDAFYKPSEITPNNFVMSGGIVAISAGLIATVSDVVGYYNGLRFTKTGIANQTFAINKDTYVDISNTGVITLVPVANGATTGFPLTANSIRLAKVVTNGAAITTITQTSNYDALGIPLRPIGGISPLQIQNPYRFRAYKTANQGITGGVVTLVTYPNKEYDPTSSFNTTNSTFTVPVSGLWFINALVQTLNGTTTTDNNLTVYINGSTLRKGGNLKNGVYPQHQVVGIFPLKAGDVLDARFANLAAADTIEGAASSNTFEGCLLAAS